VNRPAIDDNPIDQAGDVSGQPPFGEDLVDLGKRSRVGRSLIGRGGAVGRCGLGSQGSGCKRQRQACQPAKSILS